MQKWILHLVHDQMESTHRICGFDETFPGAMIHLQECNTILLSIQATILVKATAKQDDYDERSYSANKSIKSSMMTVQDIGSTQSHRGLMISLHRD